MRSGEPHGVAEDRVAVMYLGRICEAGPAWRILDAPAHHYTAALISAIPSMDPESEPHPIRLAGELPSQGERPSGCAFRLRCPAAREKCALVEPEMTPMPDGREVACHFPLADVRRQPALLAATA